jgi:outer membrane biosynthesis protein TonB
MRQALGGYDDRDDGYGLIGEERADEAPPPRDRRLPMLLLSVVAMALFAGGLWFAYVQGTRHPATLARGDGVPLLRADDRPTKVRPDQPGGMNVPDQNVSLYNEKSGGPSVEKLLPAPEQPLPRPAPLPKEVAAKEVPTAPPAAAAPPAPVAEPAVRTAAKVAPAAAKAAAPAKPAAAATPATATSPDKAGPIQIRLGSLRSPEAAREEWAKLKRDNPDLLGMLSAVAVRTDLGDKGIYYRIQAGSFADAAAAERLCGELKRRNLGCILAR